MVWTIAEAYYDLLPKELRFLPKHSSFLVLPGHDDG